MRRVLIIAATLLLALSFVSAQEGDAGNDGKALYDKYCSQCHGDTGAGDGHATPRVKPVPRDFTTGTYKFRTTPSGSLPTDEDIKRSIRDGLDYTSMPPWPQFTEPQLQSLTDYLKTFSSDFENPDKFGTPIELPAAPPISAESIERGRTVYENQGCAACHGNLGRGDGRSGPTLKDDWGNHLRAADMSMRWTFRAGATREDIFRTFSTGLNGTPMPSYADSLEAQDRWDLVDYVYSLGESDDPNYGALLKVNAIEDDLDIANPELFDGAESARFPLVGQIVQPGRNFYPSTTSIEVQAVYNREAVAFRLRWNDMRAELSGNNDPMLVVPVWDEQDHHDMGAGAAAGGGDDEDDFWGDEVEEEEDIWGDEEAGDDFWGEEEGGEETLGPDQEFSDAVALQFPTRLPTGSRKPYFIFGDSANTVDLWFIDLAKDFLQQFKGAGSDNLEAVRGDDFEISQSFEEGRWTVIIKRELESSSNVTFDAGATVPFALSVWDGFNRERGNKRALSAWFHLYLEPFEVPSPTGPMVKAALITLLIEIVIVLIVRRRFAAR